MSDPRQLARERAEATLNAALLRNLVPRQNQNALARELLSALDALEAANKSATPRARDEMFARTLRGIENELDHVSAERDRLAEQRRRLLVLCEYGYAMEFFGKYVDDPEWLTVEWLERYYGEPLPDYVCAALAGGGHEPEKQEQDLGTTASQSSVVKGEKA